MIGSMAMQRIEDLLENDNSDFYLWYIEWLESHPQRDKLVHIKPPLVLSTGKIKGKFLGKMRIK